MRIFYFSITHACKKIYICIRIYTRRKDWVAKLLSADRRSETYVILVSVLHASVKLYNPFSTATPDRTADVLRARVRAIDIERVKRQGYLTFHLVAGLLARVQNRIEWNGIATGIRFSSELQQMGKNGASARCPTSTSLPCSYVKFTRI